MVREDEVRVDMLFELTAIMSLSGIEPPYSTPHSSLPPLEGILAFVSTYLLRLADEPLAIPQCNRILRLLEEGLVDVLMRIIIQFSAWDATFAPPEFMVRPWGTALIAAAALAEVGRLEIHRYPELKLLGPLWRGSFIVVLQALTHSSQFLSAYTSPHYDSSSVLLLNSCIEFLNPVFANETFQQQEKPTLDMCRAAIPFLAKARRCLAVSLISKVPSHTSQTSAIHFSYAVKALSDATGPFDITELAGFSHKDLFRHSLTIKGTENDIFLALVSTLSQLQVLEAILDMSTSQHCLDALCSEKVVSWLAKVARTNFDVTETLTPPQIRSVLRDQMAKRFRDVFALCTRVIKITSERGMVGPSIEMLDAGFVFLVERFCTSNTVTEQDSDIIKSSIFRWIGVFDMVGDQTVRLRAIRQIRTVFSRVVAREGIADWVVELWRKLHIETSSPPIMDVCGAIGCESSETPTLQCGRCGARSYCNRFCQKKDWKSHHKARCKPLTHPTP